jgi:hypothetical protein
MNPSERFEKDWLPQIIDEEILAEGTWWYDGIMPYAIKLIHMRLNYTADDIINFGDFIHWRDWNHPVEEVSTQGDTYQWVFDSPTRHSASRCLSSLEKAKLHVKKYGKTEINWYV